MGYRIYNAGYYFIPVLNAISLHQEPPKGENKTNRKAGRKITSKLLEQKCPVFRHYQANVVYKVPKVSIYIPAYNSEKYIKSAVDSVLNQTYTDLEVCIVNDGSTDNTLKVLEENYTNNPRVRWITQKNGGISSASNTAMKICRGIYIGQLDHDDILLRLDAVEVMIKYLDTYNVGVIYSNNNYIDKNGIFIEKGWEYPKFLREQLIRSMIVHHFRMFKKRDWARLESKFDESVEAAPDYDIFLKFSEVCSMYHIKDILYGYRWHDKNVSLIHMEKQYKHHVLCIEKALGRMNLDIVWEVYVPNPNYPRNIILRKKKINDIFSLPQVYVPEKIEFLKKFRKLAVSEFSLKPFDKHKCIFVHIPKAGGTSISKSLFNSFVGALGGHPYLSEYKEIYNEIEFKNYFKFAFVRNPWDRLVSAYNFLKTGGVSEQDKNWAKSNIQQYENFDSFIKGWLNQKNIYSYYHFIPQFEFVCLDGLELAVDFVGYFENFEQDFKFVADKLGIQAELQHLNKTKDRGKRKNYTEYYTKETLKIVADVYQEDITLFGYDFKYKPNRKNFYRHKKDYHVRQKSKNESSTIITCVAILCVRNESLHIRRAVSNFIDQDINVVVIDNGSTDNTVEICKEFLGHGLLKIEYMPWNGTFDLTQQLEFKKAIIDTLDHDWIIHADADECLQSPVSGESLLEGISRISNAGYNAINFDEFVFLPINGQELDIDNYEKRFLNYYFFTPNHQWLVRAWKNNVNFQNIQHGGHYVIGDDVKISSESFILRHYQILSQQHAFQKYIVRVFSKRDLLKNWHKKRLYLTREQLKLPNSDKLKTLSHWDSVDFDRSDPKKEHFWFWNE